MSPYEILLSMPVTAMSRLRHVEIWSMGLVNPMPSFAEQREITAVLNAIIVHAPHLQVLAVPCLVTEVCLKAFKPNGDLRVLRLKDFSEFVDQRNNRLVPAEASGKSSVELPHQIISVAVSELLLVQQSCRWLNELHLGLDVQNPEVSYSPSSAQVGSNGITIYRLRHI
jgi:hypothetical protein